MKVFFFCPFWTTVVKKTLLHTKKPLGMGPTLLVRFELSGLRVRSYLEGECVYSAQNFAC